MKLQLIRNATLILDYAGSKLLIDPMLGPKHQFRSFAGIEENPTVDMPIPAEDVIAEIDGVIVTHLHPDHFDAVAQEIIPKHTPLLAEPHTVDPIKEMGFLNVQPADGPSRWNNIEIIPVPAQHGYEDWAKRMGPVSGFIFRAENEPTVYLTSDTIFYPEVENIIATYQPDIAITNSGGAQFGGPEGLIILNAEQTIRIVKLMPNGKVVATHIESLDHCTTSRADLRQAAEDAGVSGRVIIPADGELLENL